MITSFNHFSFTVADLDKSVEFYKDVFGLEFLSRGKREPWFSEAVTGVKGAELDMAFFKVGNGGTAHGADNPDVILELIEYINPKGVKLDTTPCNIGSAHVCFNVEDFDSFVERLRANNVRFRGSIEKIPAGPNIGRKVAYIEDCDGNVIELISV